MEVQKYLYKWESQDMFSWEKNLVRGQVSQSATAMPEHSVMQHPSVRDNTQTHQVQGLHSSRNSYQDSLRTVLIHVQAT